MQDAGAYTRVSDTVTVREPFSCLKPECYSHALMSSVGFYYEQGL